MKFPNLDMLKKESRLKKKSLLMTTSGAGAFDLGEEVVLAQKIGKKRKTDYVLKGSKTTAVVSAVLDKKGITVVAAMKLSELEAVVKEARLRMEAFKKIDRKRTDVKKTLVFAHLSPDITILLEEKCRTSKKKTV